jgi:hypothetical protein
MSKRVDPSARARAWIPGGSGAPGSKPSARPSNTCSAAELRLCSTLTVIRSRFPDGMSGRSSAPKRSFLIIVQRRAGSTSVIL